jgi:Tol biopolymer transport system component
MKKIANNSLLAFITALSLICVESCSNMESTKIYYPIPSSDTIPQIFLPNIVSKEGLDFNAAFSTDGKTFYFSRSKNRKYSILETKYAGSGWTEPVASDLFDTLYSNTDPFITSDGSIYFISNRPQNKSDTIDDYDIYRLKKQGEQLSEPENLTTINSDSTEYYVSVAKSGNIYFASYREGNLDLFMSRKNGNDYEKPLNLGKILNSDFEDHDPLIAPDESFMIFTSSRTGGFGENDLYIAIRKGNQWQTPINMGDKINTKGYEYCPNFSSDGKYFFYSSESEIKYISLKFIQNLIK